MQDPKTYEEAITLGFQPAPDVDELAARIGMTRRQFSHRKKLYAAENGIDCVTAPSGTKCLDWTDDQSIRTICFCTLARACGNCVQGKAR